MDELSTIMNKAIDLQKHGKLEEAVSIYLKILDIQPSNAAAMHLLGLVFHSQGKFKDAVECIGKAIIQSPDIADFHSNMAAAQLALGLPNSASRHAKKAIQVDPNLGEAYYNLGNALFSLGKSNDATSSFSTAVELDTSNDNFWSNYLFALNFSSSANHSKIFQENLNWGSSIEKDETSAVFTNDLIPDKPLRLAYFLPEFDRHVTARFIKAMVQHHDRNNFNILIYGFSENHSAPPKFITENVDGWIDTSDLDVNLVARQMRRDQVDILLHPCTFKARYRKLFVHNAAPIQVACINLVSTTGLKHATHLITDSYLSPPNEGENFFTETLVRLSSFNVYDEPKSEPEVAALPAIQNGHIVFGSFNNPAKITSDCLSLWAEILRIVPSSQLFLKHRSFENEEVCEHFLEQFKDMEVAKHRLIFSGFTQEIKQYLNTYNLVDIALDPIPFGGGTTTYESIWMGVPVLTMVGNTIMGRLTGSIMSRLGLTQFVTRDTNTYVSKAKELTSDLSTLSTIRMNLRSSAQRKIFNAKPYVEELEEACRDIWISHCKNTDQGQTFT